MCKLTFAKRNIASLKRQNKSCKLHKELGKNAKVYNHILLRKISESHLIPWCANSMERYSFCRVSGDSHKILRKLCLSTKFPRKEIRRNFDILRSV